jgi:hypothetical protein
MQIQTKTDKFNKYHNGKIYSIRSYTTEKFYIGSTCTPLHKRLYNHRNKYAQYNQGRYHFVSSFEVVKNDDCYIELLEEFKCENKDELNKREGEWIRTNLNDIVNMRIPSRTKKEYISDNKDNIHKKFDCECGGRYTYKHKYLHIRSKKHTDYTKREDDGKPE